MFHPSSMFDIQQLDKQGSSRVIAEHFGPFCDAMFDNPFVLKSNQGKLSDQPSKAEG